MRVPWIWLGKSLRDQPELYYLLDLWIRTWWPFDHRKAYDLLIQGESGVDECNWDREFYLARQACRWPT